MSDFEITLNQFGQFAAELCNEVRTFQPDLVLVLMHSGWLPFFAGRELWSRVELAPFPPVVCTNLGREKIRIFDKTVKNPHGITSWFIGSKESDPSIAFFLAWLTGKSDWQTELKLQIHEQLGGKIPQRILIVDEFIHEGSTFLLTLGLLDLLYPQAQTHFIEADLTWQDNFWEAWVQACQPQLLETEIFGPPPAGQIRHPFWQVGRQITIGSADLTPESLKWQKISADTHLLGELIQFLPVETWLSLPAWAEGIVRDEIARCAGDYLPQPPSEKKYPGLSLTQRLLRELFRHGSLSVQHISETCSLSKRRARLELLRRVDSGWLVVEKVGRENRFIPSPRLQSEYDQQSASLLACYWVAPGQLLIGDFPGWDMEYEVEALSLRLDWLLEQGVSCYLDLSEQYHYRPKTYQRLLELKATEKERAVIYRGLYTPGKNLPPRARLVEILDLIDQALASGQVVYLHGLHLGGVEDTLAGCWLVRHGLTGQQALAKIREACRELPEAWRRAPYSARARKLIRGWRE